MMSSVFRSWKLISVILIAVIMVSCAKKEAELQSNGTDEKKESRILDTPETDESGRVPSDQPVWEEGTIFDSESMKLTIVKRTHNLDLIYLLYKEKYPELTGVVTMHFVVNPDGTVQDVEVTDSNWNEMTAYGINKYLVEEISTWTFPPGLEKPTGVTQPWKFRE